MAAYADQDETDDPEDLNETVQTTILSRPKPASI